MTSHPIQCTAGSFERHEQSDKSRRVVQFAPRVGTRQSLHLADYTDDEISSTFTNGQDQQNVHADVTNTIQLARRGLPSHDNGDFCIRGLECFTNAASQQERTRNKKRAIDAVRNEQDRQWDEGVIDCNKVRQVSMLVSRQSIDAALMNAASDAAIVAREAREGTSPK